MSKFEELRVQQRGSQETYANSAAPRHAASDRDAALVRQARQLSKSGQINDAIEIYLSLFQAGELVQESHLSFGWDLSKAVGEAIGSGKEALLPREVDKAKRHLLVYLKLQVAKPSSLHSRMLQLALRLSTGDHLKVVPFLQMWGPENFQSSDFDRYEPENGKSYPALAEKAVQQAAKEAVSGGRSNDMAFIHPYVEELTVRYPDNVWMKHHLVKLLRELGRLEEARNLAIEFVRAKVGEYWAWELLGDLQAEPALRVACYCKALLCSQDDAFISNLRIKFARELVAAEFAAEAKGEIARALKYKQQAGHRISSDLSRLQEEAWYRDVAEVAPSPDFYVRYATNAESILFSQLPWIDACVGERFTVENDKGKRHLRRLYVHGSPFATEVSIPESRWPLKDLRDGEPVRLRAEYDPATPGKITVYSAERRDGSRFDLFSDLIGVIDHVNPEKGVFHYIASREAEGTYPLAAYPHDVQLGDNLNLKVAAFHSRKGKGTRVISVDRSDIPAGPSVRREFAGRARVDKGMGFTSDGIFIPPDLITANGVEDDDETSGVAVLNYNRKREQWGWKAIILNRA